jgi:hypothetical protein
MQRRVGILDQLLAAWPNVVIASATLVRNFATAIPKELLSANLKSLLQLTMSFWVSAGSFSKD